MTFSSTSYSSSILKDGELRPGVYKIQNIYSETFLDVVVHSRELCCRPARDIGEGKGLWEIKRFGAGYTVQVFEPGKPDQFCTVTNGPLEASQLSVAAFPVAWRVEIVDDDKYRGLEFIRFFWGATKWAWDMDQRFEVNHPKVITWFNADDLAPCRVWKLTPSTGSDPLPLYEGEATGQPSTHAHHAESERDDLGTIVTEVTIVTTRKRYRVEDA